MSRWISATSLLLGLAVLVSPSQAQTPPSAADLSAYSGLHAAAADGSTEDVRWLAAAGADVNARDSNGRTPLHVAAFQGHGANARALVQAGADPGLLDFQRYDAVTIVAVRDDIPTLQALLSSGASAKLITSPYDGTALIAAAHLGHHAIVNELLKAGAPLDHVNNLGWTALMEAVVLGDGGPRHVDTVRALLQAGADPQIADRQGLTPLQHAQNRGHHVIVGLLSRASAR
jgi:uncharacterized protein